MKMVDCIVKPGLLSSPLCSKIQIIKGWLRIQQAANSRLGAIQAKNLWRAVRKD